MSDGYCEKHDIYLCEECEGTKKKQQEDKIEVLHIINGCIRTGLLKYVNGQLVITKLGYTTENWKAFVDAQNSIHP